MRWVFWLSVVTVSLGSDGVQALAREEITNGSVTVRPLGEAGRWEGFSLFPAGQREPLSSLWFGSLRNITAGEMKVHRDGEAVALLFTDLKGHPTPNFRPGSFIEVSLFPNDPYPQVRFRFALSGFNEVAWRGAMGDVPFHFFACPLPGAEVFHQRGWMIGTPVIDPYILLNEARVNFIRARWAKGWSYAPPFGAYPLPVVGLWDASEGRYVAFEFLSARLTDHSERPLASAYCWELGAGRRREFFALVFPHAGEGFRSLRYPKGDEVIASHFRILWSTNLPLTDAPNRFIHRWLWENFSEKLPDAPPYTEFGWLPRNMRLKAFPKPNLRDLFVRIQKGHRFQKPGNIAAVGVPYAFPVIDYQFLMGRKADLKRLREQLDWLAENAERFSVDGDPCVFWKKPIRGDWHDRYGEGVPTLRNVQGFMVAQAFLDAIKNGWRDTRYLGVVDGVRRWAKHFLYTRNCYDDVPDAPFAWSAAPIAHFLFSYHYTFRDDPDPKRRWLAETAKDLGHAVVYRYLTVFPCDNDPDDAIDASFFMEPNAGFPWLGSACANEIWAFAHALLEAYVVTGDPLLGHYFRGMMERWHILMRDEWYPRIADYVGAFAEMFGLFDDVVIGRGKRSTFGGLWGGLEHLAYPVGTAKVRFVCGEGAAMAFNKDAPLYDIAEYRWARPSGRQPNLRFRLVALTPSLPKERVEVMVTVPHFDLRAVPVTVLREGQRVSVTTKRFLERPDTLSIAGVQVGDQITLGSIPDGTPVLPGRIAKPRRPLWGSP